MQQAVRSYLSAGVALAGAGVVAVAPIAPTLPAIEAAHSAPAVELSALVNPFHEYAVAFNVAFQNIAALGERIAQNPTPILSQIIENQIRSATGIAEFVTAFGGSVVGQVVRIPGQLQVAAGQLADGNVTLALNTVLNAALAPIVQAVVDTLLFNPDIYEGFQQALRQPIANLLNVIDLTSYPNVLNLLGPLLAPVQLLTDVTNAIGAAGDGIVSGVRNGDLEEVANALLSLGPDVTYAVLNGSAGFSAGIFGANGIIAGLLTIRDLIAGAITPKPTVTAAVADVPSVSARTVTLDVAPAVGGDLDQKSDATESAAATAPAAPSKESTPAATEDDSAPAADTADDAQSVGQDADDDATTAPVSDDATDATDDTDADVSVTDPAADDAATDGTDTTAGDKADDKADDKTDTKSDTSTTSDTPSDSGVSSSASTGSGADS